MNKYVISCGLTCGLMIANHAFATEKIATTAPKPAIEVVKSVKPTVEVVKSVKPAVEVVKSEKPTVIEVKTSKTETSPALCFARGLANVSLCWLEIPRCMSYDNEVIPFFGLIVGIPEGAVYTVGRAISGIVDIITFGTVGDALYSKKFPDLIWDAKWKPAKK